MKRIIIILLFLFCTAPAYAQWEWLNPLPEGNEFYDATFVSPQIGWIVGGNGSLMKTVDGGAHWTSQTNILRTTPFIGLSITFVDAQTGVITMNNGMMLRTTDGGQDWDLLPRTGMVLQKTALAPDGTLWGVGSLGAIARSTDDGQTWDPFSTGINTVVFDIDFPDAQTAVAVCGGGKVLRSTDGGINWDSHTTPLTTDLRSVSFRNATDGFAIQQPKYLLRTTDGGQNWTDTSFTVNELLDVHFVSENVGWLVSNSPGSVYKTTDGGMSWQFVAVEQPRRFTFYAVYPLDEQNVVLLGTGGAVFTSNDGGANWTQRGTAFTRQHLHGVRAVSDTSAWVFGDGSAFFTSDRGSSWHGSDTISLPGFRSGYALSETRIIATGSQGQVMLSTDAGQSWSTQVISTLGQIEEIDFVDENTGWLTGAHGTIARTTDGGGTWEESDAGVDHDFNGVAARSAQEAWIAGNGGVIFHTSDGGTNWTEQTTPITTNLQTIEFTSATEGWAGGQLALLHTTDGGATWFVENKLVGLDVIYDINFTDAQHGFIMLSRAVARTSDGGSTFYRTDYPSLGLQDLDARPGGALWLVGRYGVTQYYTPTAAIVIQPDNLDFGDVPIGQQEQRTITVYNRGEVDLEFTNFTVVGPGFLYINGDLSAIPPGGARQVTLGFAPQDTGTVYGNGTVYSNAALGVPFVGLRGHGIPAGTSALEHTPDTLDFGNILLGKFDIRHVYLHNRSTQTLLINREVMSGGDSLMFQVTQESTFIFSADKRDSVQITFAPVRQGKFHSTLLIESNDKVEPMYRVDVIGEAVTPIIGATGLDFGYVYIDSSKTLDLAIHNIGTSALNISDITMVGSDATEFNFTNPGPGAVAAGDSLVFPVSFLPRTYGGKSAQIIVTSDDLTNGMYAIPLVGNATTLGTEDIPLAEQLTLHGNYPNPVSAQRLHTSFRVELPARMHLRLTMHDVLGRAVRTVYTGTLAQGMHTIAANLEGFVPGTYLAVLEATQGGSSVRRELAVIIR
ncbi:choice-of-anchor D domain-containing protein [bacterium]|nr:choice-of-anchor D domain-containing protein [bacterium]